LKNNSIFESITELSSITQSIELSGGTEIQENMIERIIKLKYNKHLNFLVHSYFPPPSENFVLNFADTSNKTREFIKESMKYIDMLNIPYYSIHTGFKQDFNIKNEILIDGSNNFSINNIYENISWFYSNFKKKLALENLFPNNQNDTCFGSSFDDIINILDTNKNVYLLLDFGHLKVSSRYYGFNYLNAINTLFNEYGNRILEIHVSENDGLEDKHNLIYSDSIQYMILDKFKDIINSNKINIIIEARNYSLIELEECNNLIKEIIGEE
jgi:uncharacterized protein (UPF0276 family)